MQFNSFSKQALSFEPLRCSPRCVPHLRRIRFSLTRFLRAILAHFTGESWETRVMQEVGGRSLPRYQTAVCEEEWQRCRRACRGACSSYF